MREHPPMALECRVCGFERTITREQILAGSWRRQPCPACGAVREPPASGPADSSDVRIFRR